MAHNENTPIAISYKMPNFEYSHLRSDPGKFAHIELSEHSYYEIFFLLQGNVIYFVNGKEFMLSPHDVLCINRFESHAPRIIPTEGYERIFIHFHQEFIQSYYSFITPLLQLFSQTSDHTAAQLRLDPSSMERVMQILQEMESLFPEKDNDRILHLFLQLLFLLNIAYIDVSSLPENPANKNSKIMPVVDWIDAHYMEPINLDELSKQFYINKYYLCHVFKEHTGFSPINYINFKRIMRAAYLMSKNTPITDCCYSVGFNNYSAFYKSFVKYFGCGPREYIDSILS